MVEEEGNTLINAKPFLKWAGGKRQLSSQLEIRFPKGLESGEIKRYVEPFIGGGALFFHLLSKYQIPQCYINDNNKLLINTYKVIRNDVYKLIDHLLNLQKEYNKCVLNKKNEYYYLKRVEFNKIRNNRDKYSKIEIASLVIFLNKTCYNGLYRTNREGDFNVPFGRNPNPTICNTDNLLAVNKSLKNTKISAFDFKKFISSTLQHSGPETFIYADPPYTVKHGNNGFINYNDKIFSWKDQLRLYTEMCKLASNGVKIMISNAKHDDIKNLYSKKRFHLHELSRQSLIGGKGSSRGQIQELMFTTYPVNLRGGTFK